jgi:hypothetical protein
MPSFGSTHLNNEKDTFLRIEPILPMTILSRLPLGIGLALVKASHDDHRFAASFITQPRPE